MRIRSKGFALIAVILSVTAVFAVTVYGALVLRSTLTETNALAARSTNGVVAHSAAVLAVSGLVSLPADDTLDLESLDALGGLAGGLAGGGPGEGGAAAAPELPPFLVALLGEVGAEIEEATRESGVGAGGTNAAVGALAGGDSTTSLRASEVLQRVGLPPEGVVVRFPNAIARVWIGDAIGKLNINNADDEQLLAYFQALGLREFDAVTLTNQILDWIDSDPIPRERSFERDRYARLGLRPADSDIRYIDELRYLPAMDEDVMRRIRRDFSVGSQGAMYLGTASDAAMRAIGLNERQVQGIRNIRTSGPLTAERLRVVVDLGSDRWRSTLSLAPSPLLELRVEVFPPNTSRFDDVSPSSVFEGIAVLTNEGLRDLALRPGGG